MAFYDQISDSSSFTFWLGPNPKDGFNVFARSYRQAAESLAKALLARPTFAEYEAYPVVFLYRHALELALKHAIYKASAYADLIETPGVDGSAQNRHELMRLAKVMRTSLTTLRPDDEWLAAILIKVDSSCRDLDQIDASSFVYRYPIDKGGSPSAPPSQVVNLRSFARHMSALLEDIDTINFALNAEKSQIEDATSDSIRNGFLFESG